MERKNKVFITLDPITDSVIPDTKHIDIAIPRLTFDSPERWTINEQSYKKYGFNRLITNNIYSAIFLLALIFIAIFSPRTLTGTGYIAVISVSIMLLLLILTVVCSSLMTFFAAKSSFIETIDDIPVLFTPESGFTHFRVSIIDSIYNISVTDAVITVKGHIKCKTYDKKFRLIECCEKSSADIPRIFDNEESLILKLNSMRENKTNA